jgi:hypothetical protein
VLKQHLDQRLWVFGSILPAWGGVSLRLRSLLDHHVHATFWPQRTRKHRPATRPGTVAIR